MARLYRLSSQLLNLSLPKLSPSILFSSLPTFVLHRALLVLALLVELALVERGCEKEVRRVRAFVS